MAHSSARFRYTQLIQSALTLIGAVLVGSLTPDATFADSTPLADGTYLYGQQSIANEAGSAYMVFEVVGQRTVGAFYMPNSSFDCFYGDISTTRLDLTVFDSYERTGHPYSIAVQSSLVAGQAGTTFNLTGFTPINTLSSMDTQILDTCQTDHADFI